ncbi:MAG: VOC family protein [Betaproteobacteria bacterium]|nr:VOC family protein [Betaproteobacteria bacterium]MBV9361436.1 VOC family protein [Betaproteobacteria bacterium]
MSQEHDLFGRLRLAYLALRVSDLGEWKRFASEMLGVPDPAVRSDGALAYRLDDKVHRFVLRKADSDDVDALGWEVDSEQDFKAVLARAEQAGAHPVSGNEDEAKARHVARLAHFEGPDGVRNELVMGLQSAPTAFQSTLVPGGFRTGAMGLGHAVLVASDAQAAGRFYREVLGMRLSQDMAVRIGPFDIKGVFLHCNPRHHSLALFELPCKTRLQHVMIEANEFRDVGVAWERARRLGIPITLSLGQHPEPDCMVSFYGMTPSGFEFEIGADGKLIDGAHFQPITLHKTSDWGHHPTLRAKWNLISAAVSAKFRRPSVA